MTNPPPSATTNADAGELAKFSAVAHRWWDPQSEFRSLHEMNPLRLSWIEAQAGETGREASQGQGAVFDAADCQSAARRARSLADDGIY